MKKILMVLALACAALLLTQCKKQIVEQPSVTPTGEKVEVSLNVTDDGSKTGISETGIVTWNVDDVLYVVGESDGCLGTISAQNSGSTAYFTGTITKPSTATQDFHFYYTGSKGFTLDGDCFTYDISNQKGTLANIAANLHLMHGIIKNVDKNTTNFGTITMKNMMSIVKLSFSRADGNALGTKVICTGGYSGVKFNVKTGVDEYGSFLPEGRVRYKKGVNLTEVTSSVYYMVVLPGVQTLEFSQGLKGLSCPGPVGGFQANMLYNENNPKSVVLDEMTYLPAIFTVNNGADGEQGTDDDTQVKFSKGNLQYNPSGEKWRFATNQYGLLHNTNDSDVSDEYNSTYTDWIDLFGWGCTGFVDTRNTDHDNWYQTNYMPYSTSKSEVNATYNYYGYGPDYISSPYYSLTVANKSDWGYNAIYSGVTSTTGWCTLTSAEWKYLLDTRKVTVGDEQKESYGEGNVNGINGLIILPDNWDGSVCPGFIYGDISWSNTFTESTTTKWSAMESAGAVFLPAAGVRIAQSVRDVGSKGNYWSSSYNSSKHANQLYFDSSNGVYSQVKSTRHCGFSVRLVKKNTNND